MCFPLTDKIFRPLSYFIQSVWIDVIVLPSKPVTVTQYPGRSYRHICRSSQGAIHVTKPTITCSERQSISMRAAALKPTHVRGACENMTGRALNNLLLS